MLYNDYFSNSFKKFSSMLDSIMPTFIILAYHYMEMGAKQKLTGQIARFIQHGMTVIQSREAFFNPPP